MQVRQWSWPCLDGSASSDDGRGSLPAVLLSSLARQASLGSPVISQAVKLSKPGGSVAGGGWRPPAHGWIWLETVNVAGGAASADMHMGCSCFFPTARMSRISDIDLLL